MQAEIIRKKTLKEKKRPVDPTFFLAFLDQIYPLNNPLYVINFSKKLLSRVVNKNGPPDF